MSSMLTTFTESEFKMPIDGCIMLRFSVYALTIAILCMNVSNFYEFFRNKIKN